jgi:hypothetical protein
MTQRDLLIEVGLVVPGNEWSWNSVNGWHGPLPKATNVRVINEPNVPEQAIPQKEKYCREFVAGEEIA